MPDVLAWYYNSRNGWVTQLPLNLATIELHIGVGWHGPFNSKQEAFDYYNRNASKNPGWKAPTTKAGEVLSNAPDAATASVEAATTPFKGLNLETWVLRIGELVLGIVLIGVGLAKLTGTTNLIAKAAKVAIP